jgi:signal peptidase I
MEDTLLVGDHVLVDKLAYAPAGPVSRYLLPYTEIRHGDIIVFRYPVDPKQTFVKRAIGLPGDRIRIVNKLVYRNGVRIDEPYVYHKSEIVEAYRDNFPDQPYLSLNERAVEMLERNVVNNELVVPANSVFAMGDNRDRSLDSRFWGFVPRENVIGKPLMVYWSYATTTDRLSDPTINIRHLADIVQHFFTKTRWERTFRLIHGYQSNN